MISSAFKLRQNLSYIFTFNCFLFSKLWISLGQKNGCYGNLVLCLIATLNEQSSCDLVELLLIEKHPLLLTSSMSHTWKERVLSQLNFVSLSRSLFQLHLCNSANSKFLRITLRVRDIPTLQRPSSFYLCPRSFVAYVKWKLRQMTSLLWPCHPLLRQKTPQAIAAS